MEKWKGDMKNMRAKSPSKCGHLCPNVLNRKQSSNGTSINPKFKLHAKRGKITIFFLTKLKNLTPPFWTPESSWKFQWNQQCHLLQENASAKSQKAQSCSAKSRPEETQTFSDKIKKANKNSRVQKVHSSRRAKLFAWRSEKWSRISFIATLLLGTYSCGDEKSSRKNCSGQNSRTSYKNEQCRVTCDKL